MKLVIQTQVKENYGAHDWDGEGSCPQYWKFKGGHTVVVRDITPAQAIRISEGGIPTLAALIEQRNDHYEEYILDYSVEDNAAPEGEPWETPVEFYWGGDRWLARTLYDNTTEYGHMRADVAGRVEGWIPLEGGERSDYTARYYNAAGEEMVEYSVPRVVDTTAA